MSRTLLLSLPLAGACGVAPGTDAAQRVHVACSHDGTDAVWRFEAESGSTTHLVQAEVSDDDGERLATWSLYADGDGHWVGEWRQPGRCDPRASRATFVAWTPDGASWLGDATVGGIGR